MNLDTMVCHNLSEDLVESCLDECIANSGVCGCNICRIDVKAYALNNIKPHYVVTHKGNLFARLNATSPQAKADILQAIAKGIEVVRKHPRH